MKHLKSQMADILVRYMETKRITQTSLAAELGVSCGTLSEWLDPSKHGMTSRNAARIKAVCREVLTEEERGTRVKGEPVELAVEVALDAFMRDAMGAVMASDAFSDDAKLAFCAILKGSRARVG